MHAIILISAISAINCDFNQTVNNTLNTMKIAADHKQQGFQAVQTMLENDIINCADTYSYEEIQIIFKLIRRSELLKRGIWGQNLTKMGGFYRSFRAY